MARTAERELDERKAHLLGILSSRGAEARPVPLSHAALSEALGTTECRARCSLRALEADGMLAVHARFLSNGGQKENAYRITPRGRRWLARIEEGRGPGGARPREGRERGDEE